MTVGEGGGRSWGSRSEGARRGQCVRVRVCACVRARAWLLSEARVGPQADQVALTSMMPVG